MASQKSLTEDALAAALHGGAAHLDAPLSHAYSTPAPAVTQSSQIGRIYAPSVTGAT